MAQPICKVSNHDSVAVGLVQQPAMYKALSGETEGAIVNS
jgi:hypothetical protein